jgi:dehydrogenase/reductase SDR family protein 7
MVHEMRMSATTFAIVTLLVCFLVITLPLPIIVAGTLLVICLSDADLTLTACQWFGKRPQELKGKVVWITGASSGIGEALAYELATIGCKLILSSRREVELERVRQKCVELSPPDFREAHMVMRLDVADYDSHQTCVEEVIAKYSRIDYLVNNAGRSQLAPALDTSLEVDKTILNLNTIGTISLTKAVLPHMVQRKEGLIAFVSSIVGKFGE